MASMGSLGHYMQETSRAGFAIRDFLHEGNGDIWLAALEGPRPFARLDADRGEGAKAATCSRSIAREHPQFLDGYSARVRRGRRWRCYQETDQELRD